MNAKEWREEMSAIRDDLRAGKISVSAAMAVIKAGSTAMQFINGQLRYYEMRQEAPDIDFLKEE